MEPFTLINSQFYWKHYKIHVLYKWNYCVKPHGHVHVLESVDHKYLQEQRIDMYIIEEVRNILAKGFLTAITHIQKPVIILVRFVYGAHKTGCRWKSLSICVRVFLTQGRSNPTLARVNKTAQVTCLRQCVFDKNKQSFSWSQM